MPTDANRDGRILADRYRLGAQIGAGGMGAVHRALDLRLEREVAVKLLPAAALGNDDARKRLVREALAIAALRHPGIVHVYDVGETDDGGAYLVMELVVGAPLRALVFTASWSDDARIAAVVEAARALAAAHRAGLIHRDVKPDNLMLRDDGRVVLLDFGIAKPAGPNGDVRLTGEGVVVGTPAYLSPEQARGAPVDARTDQFSLAVTAFEILARAPPWTGSSALDIVAATLKDPTPRLELADPALASAVRPLLERALAKRPEDRYPDLDAFADALSLAAGLRTSPLTTPSSLPIAAQSAPTFDPGAVTEVALRTPTPAAHATTLLAPTFPRPRLPRRRLAIAAMSLVLAAATAWIIGGLRARRNPLSVAHPRLACPMLEGHVDGKPAPWLGAAAAYRLADDLAPMLGGFTDHVRSPGQLLALPGYSPDAHDLDPWERPQLREESIRAAASAGDAWLDGRIEARGAQVALSVVVRTPSGRELGRAESSGASFDAAALAVSRMLRATGALGGPHALDPAFARWQGVATGEEQDATMDLDAAALGHSPPPLCKLTLPSRLPATWRAAIGDACAGRALDPSSPLPALARAVAAVPSSITEAVRERFERDAESAPADGARALARAASLRAEDKSGAGAVRAILAVVAVDPRTGWNAVEEGLQTANPSLIANGLVWAPDNSDWWLTATRAAPTEDRTWASRLQRRQFLLLPTPPIAVQYADALLREGSGTDLGVVVAYLAGASDADARELGRLVGERAAVLDGAFARTLERWTEELSGGETFKGDTIDVNPRITAARELAYALEGEVDLATHVARRIAETPGKPRLVEDNVTIRPNVAALCALAEPSLARRCLAAIEPPEGVAPLQREDWRRMRNVVELYVARDFRGAANAARGLMGSRYYPYYLARFGDFLVDVHDRGGTPEIAEEIDRARVSDRNLAGASLAALRAARRASARGDKARARELATRVVEAWKLVDTTVPAVAEMRTLLAAP